MEKEEKERFEETLQWAKDFLNDYEKKHGKTRPLPPRQQ